MLPLVTETPESAIAKLNDGSLEYVPDCYEDNNDHKKTAFIQVIFENRKVSWMRSLLKYFYIKFRSEGKPGANILICYFKAYFLVSI